MFYSMSLQQHTNLRGSRSQMFFKIGALKNLAIEPATLLKIKKRFQRGCFPANLAKFFRTALFKENLRWLLLCPFLFLFVVSDLFLGVNHISIFVRNTS